MINKNSKKKLTKYLHNTNKNIKLTMKFSIYIHIYI